MALPSTTDPASATQEQRKEIGEPRIIRVLVVDDVQENLELLDDVLTDGGYAPVTARNALQALDILRREEVHLVIADAMMPKMDGFQLCKEVRSIPGYDRTPFIIYTGNYVDDSDQEFAHNIGVDRYVVKGTGVGELFEAINELVRQRYGHLPEPAGAGEARLDDQEFLEQHRALVIKKLEQKMAELEVYAQTLERKNREVHASEERYRALFESASIPIFVVDRESGKVLDVNRQGIDLLGYARDELTAMTRLPFADAGEFAKGILDASRFVAGETTIRRADGEVLDVDVGVGPVTRPQDSRMLLYVRDITEQKKMREHLLQAEKMALMGRLAAGIAHEVRNPLAAITLNLQYLAAKGGLDVQMVESIGNALEGAKRVESVIENTLSLARVSPPVLQPEAVNGIVAKVIGFIEMASRQKDVRVETELGCDLPAVRVDARQIEQVLLNIVQNAIDASPVGELVTLTTCMAEPAAEVKVSPAVCIMVRDRGAGVPPEHRKYLFQQFRTTKPGGTGLGLVLSRQILERHGGTVTLEDAPGGGTVVRIVIPTQS